MKLIAILIFAFSFQAFAIDGMTQEKISLQLSNMPIKQVFKVIESKTDYRFIFSEDVIKEETIISVKAKDANIQRVMQQIQEKTDIEYKIVDKNLIAITRQNAENAAAIRINGTVTNSDGIPLPGVSVEIKNKSMGAITDEGGKFVINADLNDVLSFIYLGYKTKEVVYTGQNVINVVLEAGEDLLSEVVITGYGGSQSRTKTTASISKVDTTIFQNALMSNPAKALSGAIPGLRVTQTSGAPGNVPNIVLRGGTDFYGGGGPLVIIDGVPTNSFNNINPEDIASMDILKDAGASAIYGARAANGVILITTKRGKSGRSEISFNVDHGWSYLNKAIDFLGARDYLYWIRTAIKRAMDLGYKDASALSANEAFGTGNTYYDPKTGVPLNPNLNGNALYTTMLLNEQNKNLLDSGWQKMTDPVTGKELIFKENKYTDFIFQNPAQTKNYNLSASGGNEKGSYYASIGYYHEEGLPVYTYTRRFNGTLNADYKIREWLTSMSSFKFVDNKWLDPPFTDYNTYFGRLSSLPPVMRQYTPNGSLVAGRVGWEPNPLYMFNRQIRNNGSNLYNFGQTLKFDLLKGFNVTLGGAWNMRETLLEHMNKDFIDGPGRVNKDRWTYAQVQKELIQTLNAVASYKNSFGQHHVDFMVGSEYINYFNFFFDASGKGAPTDDFMDLGLTIQDKGARAINTDHSKERSLGAFARLNYDYNDKYLLSLIGRRDGYSKLLGNNRWGFFPGLSAGWIISKEQFMQGTQEWFNFLKLRAGYGDVGNVSVIGRYDLQGSYYSTTYGNQTGFYLNGIPNPNLKWEHTKTAEIGLDMAFLNNRVTSGLTYYNKNTFDKIANIPMPHSGGQYTFLNNNGQTRSTGVEIDTRFSIIQRKDFNWSVSFNAAWNKVKTIKLPYNGLERNRQGAIQIYHPATGQKIWVGGLQEGYEPGGLYAYEAVGIYKNDAEIKQYSDTLIDRMGSRYIYGPGKWDKMSDADKAKGFPISPGDVRWKDVNKDGVIDEFDQIYVGNSLPRWIGGISSNLSWKGINLFIRTDFALKYYQLDNISSGNNYMAFFMGFMQGSFNNISAVKDTWTSENPNAQYPVVNWADQLGKRNYYRTSTVFAYESSYIALREVTLAYNLPALLISKVRLQGLSLHVTGQDLGYLTKSKFYNPEIGGGTAVGYNLPRRISVGINATF